MVASVRLSILVRIQLSALGYVQRLSQLMTLLRVVQLTTVY